MDRLLEWVLVEYEDHQAVDTRLRCECGRALRYRYTVLHKTTGKEYRLGIVHFQQHTGLDPEIVRLIKKGFTQIDFERDEILSKVLSGWKMPFSISVEIEVPGDMKEQLRVKLPLLDRQVKRLSEIVEKYNKENELRNELRKLSIINPVELYKKMQSSRITSSEAKDLFDYINKCPGGLEKYNLDKQKMKSAAYGALGRIANKDIRFWLVEIAYM